MTVKELIKEMEKRNISLNSHLEMGMYDSDKDEDLTLYPDGMVYYDEYHNTVILTVY